MGKQKKKQNGITLIALVISIIVMLILAGVSLNAIIGENGIIKQAQNATYQTGIAALEEYLQQEYTKYYDEDDDYNTKVDLLIYKHPNFFLKDGSNNYVLNTNAEGVLTKYYLINKSNLPKDIRDCLVGGDTVEYSKYIRLIDVYGVTPDLKVYYMSNGVNGDTVLGNLNNEELDPSTSLVKVNKDSKLKNAINSALGLEEGHEITISDIQGLKKFTLDGSQYSVTSISALSEATSLQELTLKNLSLDSLEGIQNCINLRYIYFSNCNIQDYTHLASVFELDTLYMYFPPTMVKDVANSQVSALSLGLKEASNLTKLVKIGISGINNIFINEGGNINDSQIYRIEYTNISTLNDISKMSEINQVIRNNLKILYLNNISISNVNVLSNYPNLQKVYVFRDSNLTTLTGLENHTNMSFLAANYCALTSISGLSGCSKLSTCYINGNSNLTSLNGLGNSLKVQDETNSLIAFSCDITDITALSGNNVLRYLSLYSNVNLEQVETLGDLTNLNQLYLANNEKMIGIQVGNALNNSETHILKNCGNNYSLPQKYTIYFESLPYYDFSNMDLTDDSDEINSIIGKTSIQKLNLSGNPQLSDTKLQAALSTLTDLRALSLKGCSNLKSLNFIGEGKVTKLTELDIRDTSDDLKDLTNLDNYSSQLKSLILNNTATDFKTIQNAINNMYNRRREGNAYSLIGTNYWEITGLVLTGDQSQYNFKDCDNITHYSYSNYLGKFDDASGVLDLSKCKNLTYVYFWANAFNIKLGEKVTYLWHTGRDNNIALCDLSLCKSLNEYYFENANIPEELKTLNSQAKLTTIKSFRRSTTNFSFLTYFNSSYVTTIDFWSNGVGYQPLQMNSLNGLENATNLSSLRIEGTKTLKGTADLSKLTNLTTIEFQNLPELEKIILINDTGVGSKGITNIDVKSGSKLSEIKGIEQNTNLATLDISNCNFSSLNMLTNLKNLSSVNLSGNGISDLGPLKTLLSNCDNHKPKFTSLNLSSNVIQNNATSGTNNINVLIDLWNAGCKSINVTSNKFQDTSGLSGYSGISY